MRGRTVLGRVAAGAAAVGLGIAGGLVSASPAFAWPGPWEAYSKPTDAAKGLGESTAGCYIEWALWDMKRDGHGVGLRFTIHDGQREYPQRVQNLGGAGSVRQGEENYPDDYAVYVQAYLTDEGEPIDTTYGGKVQLC
ncbi:hypothetical protein K1W54_31525 [Micromonospora sp. CPCC 205371]|nr:hypothetical protein [Micromonospora sp. CPCC 205371]